MGFISPWMVMSPVTYCGASGTVDVMTSEATPQDCYTGRQKHKTKEGHHTHTHQHTHIHTYTICFSWKFN